MRTALSEWRDNVAPMTAEPVFGDAKEGTRTVASFSVRYRQYLDADGRAAEPLPAFAHDADVMRQLYQAMVLTRTFDAKAIAMQRTGQIGTYPSVQGQEAVSVGFASAMTDDDVLFSHLPRTGRPDLARREPGRTPSVLEWRRTRQRLRRTATGLPRLRDHRRPSRPCRRGGDGDEAEG